MIALSNGTTTIDKGCSLRAMNGHEAKAISLTNPLSQYGLYALPGARPTTIQKTPTAAPAAEATKTPTSLSLTFIPAPSSPVIRTKSAEFGRRLAPTHNLEKEPSQH